MPDKPSSNEEEYFLKQDAELVKEMRSRLDAERKATERKSHYMKCPKCGADLKEHMISHVAVDVCPECGGVWLDAGELDLLRKVKEYRFGSLFAEIFRSLPGK
ncbi:MAG: zf-TFIIB domain-containing protein [Gemmatimonadaceae bacterium]|nr:zf-TFIIB domain-containing protein [Gemmatimonadaceae bacterium]